MGAWTDFTEAFNLVKEPSWAPKFTTTTQLPEALPEKLDRKLMNIPSIYAQNYAQILSSLNEDNPQYVNTAATIVDKKIEYNAIMWTLVHLAPDARTQYEHFLTQRASYLHSQIPQAGSVVITEEQSRQLLFGAASIAQQHPNYKGQDSNPQLAGITAMDHASTRIRTQLSNLSKYALALVDSPSDKRSKSLSRNGKLLAHTKTIDKFATSFWFRTAISWGFLPSLLKHVRVPNYTSVTMQIPISKQHGNLNVEWERDKQGTLTETITTPAGMRIVNQGTYHTENVRKAYLKLDETADRIMWLKDKARQATDSQASSKDAELGATGSRYAVNAEHALEAALTKLVYRKGSMAHTESKNRQRALAMQSRVIRSYENYQERHAEKSGNKAQYYKGQLQQAREQYKQILTTIGVTESAAKKIAHSDNPKNIGFGDSDVVEQREQQRVAQSAVEPGWRGRAKSGKGTSSYDQARLSAAYTGEIMSMRAETLPANGLEPEAVCRILNAHNKSTKEIDLLITGNCAISISTPHHGLPHATPADELSPTSRSRSGSEGSTSSSPRPPTTSQSPGSQRQP